MTMKLPSLDTAEGIVVLGLAGFIVYIAWKSASAIKDTVIDPLVHGAQAVGEAVSATGHAIAASVPKQADFDDARQAMTDAGDSGIDGTGLWPLPNPTTDGLGTDSRLSALPQVASPSALTTTDVSMADLTGEGW